MSEQTPTPQEELEVPLPPVVAVQEPLTPYQKKKLKLMADLEDAKLMEQLGQKVMKIKTRVLQRMGEHLQHCGVRTVGHGRVVLAGSNADQAFVRCGEAIDNMLSENNPLRGDTIVELFKIQAVFNAQILSAGEAHLKADRLPEPMRKDGQIQQAFPPGNNTVVVVNAATSHVPPAALPPLT